MKKLFVTVVLAVLAVTIASAKTYNVTLFQASVVGGTELKPGEYKVELNNDKVKITNGRQTGEATVRVQTAERKFGSTTVKYSNGDGKSHVQEIRLGGTSMLLVFPES